jgi:hypothetical protein
VNCERQTPISLVDRILIFGAGTIIRGFHSLKNLIMVLLVFFPLLLLRLSRSVLPLPSAFPIQLTPGKVSLVPSRGGLRERSELVTRNEQNEERALQC